MSREGQNHPQTGDTNRSVKTDDTTNVSQEMADEMSSTTKNQVADHCRTPIERNLLAHFFFIFAASFILGVIFLHSSLQFWSWQVNDISDHVPYGSQHDAVPSELILYQQQQKNQADGMGNIFTITISPNMTISLTR